MERKVQEEISALVQNILSDYGNDRQVDQLDIHKQPDRDVVIDIIYKLLRVIFPGYYRDRTNRFYNIQNNLHTLMEDILFHLNEQLVIVLRYHKDYQSATDEELAAAAQNISMAFFRQIPKIRAYVDTDLQAALDGDPATSLIDEVVIAYPGLLAVTINRLAHELYLLSVPLLPRIMTEYAHSVTGIDIHPGATIGKYFFIDHGTGIVVGETTVIGDHVKVYQNVTLGALSTRDSQKLRGTKRHPTLEDNVTIYSGASVLGGETVIGKGAVIGGNAFITKSIPAGARVSVKNQEMQIKYCHTPRVQTSDLEEDSSWYYTI